MTFYQEYMVEEAGFGTQTIRIVVSDKVSDLYLKDINCDYACDCIDTDTTKETLSLANNKFGIDELKFNIHGAATLNSDGNKYVNAFILEAENKTKSRFIAKFFNPPVQSDPDYLIKLLASVVFRGKINFNVQGTDIDWKGAIYSGTINPLRDWSFQALSIDFSLLEKVLINERIELENLTKIQGIFGHEGVETERITTAETDAIFKPRLAYQGYPSSYPGDYYTDPAWFYNHFYRLGSLFKAIQLLLNKAADILNEIYTDQAFTITLLESSLTLKTQPTGFGLTIRNLLIPAPGSTLPVPQIDLHQTDAPGVYSVPKKIQLQIAAGDDDEIADDLVSPIFFHERMFNPSLNIDSMTWSADREETEKLFSFRQYDNLLVLLLEIARSLRCFVNLSLTQDNDIQVQFISIDDVVETDSTELIDAQDASLELSGNSNEGKPTTYFGLANNLAMEGVDRVISKDITYDGTNPDTELYKLFEGKAEDNLRLERWQKKNEELKKFKEIESKRLLFSTSPTIEYANFACAHQYPRFTNYAPRVGNVPAMTVINQPINIVHYVNKAFEQPPLSTVYRAMPERLHTGLFIRVKKTSMAYNSALEPFYDVGTDDNLFCPCNQIHIKYDGVEQSFDTLTDYINYSMGIDEQFYVQEYSLTVPYWNGFKLLGVANWKNIKRGSKIPLTWNVITWNGANFVEAPVTKTFIANEIERKWQSPVTNLKLHYEGRFSFTQSVSSGVLADHPLSEMQPNFLIKNIKTYDALQDISAGDAVMLYSTGVVRGIPYHDYHSKIIGIALNTALNGEKVDVQVADRVYNENYSSIFTGHIGEYVYCRMSTLPTLNISANCLTAETGFEDIIWILGKIETATSFLLNIMEIPFGGHYPEPPPP